jgi:hypothetical protein
MCFFSQARCLCYDKKFPENLCPYKGHNEPNHICEKSFTIDGWPHDVPISYDHSSPPINMQCAAGVVNLSSLLEHWTAAVFIGMDVGEDGGEDHV